MFSPLRNRFGIPGVISVIALVFAMLGGAYAATDNGGGGKATASAKAKKGPRGPKGATGPAGPAGPAGPQGPAGANGKDGANGTNGSNGADGKSVTGTSFAGSKGGCTEGGIEFAAAAGTTFACNGKKGTPGTPGAPGAPGSPWTAGGTLPIGATETGGWAVGDGDAMPTSPGFFVFLRGPISFTIPLADDLDAEHVQANPIHFPTGATEEQEENCPGSAADPKAASGFLCVYTTALNQQNQDLPALENIFVNKLSTTALFGAEAFGADKFGALVLLATRSRPPESGLSADTTGYGSWAVTG